MKVTQFETTPSFFLRPYELKPTGGRMGGADVIEVRDTPNRQKFTGFGVAVTGSSCYNLNLMPEDERFLTIFIPITAWGFRFAA